MPSLSLRWYMYPRDLWHVYVIVAVNQLNQYAELALAILLLRDGPFWLSMVGYGPLGGGGGWAPLPCPSPRAPSTV